MARGHRHRGGERRVLGVEIQDAPVRRLRRADAAAPDVQRDGARVGQVDQGRARRRRRSSGSPCRCPRTRPARCGSTRGRTRGRSSGRTTCRRCRPGSDRAPAAGRADRAAAPAPPPGSSRSDRPWCSPRPARRPCPGGSARAAARGPGFGGCGRPLGRRLLAAALRRALVVAQPVEHRVAQLAGLGHLGVAHLGDQLGLDPDVLLAGRRRAGRTAAAARRSGSSRAWIRFSVASLKPEPTRPT